MAIATGNPLLGTRAERAVEELSDGAAHRMTVGGTISATGVMFVILLTTGWFGWQAAADAITVVTLPSGEEVVSGSMPGWVWACLLGALLVAFATIFMPRIARFTAVIYAALEGVVLGAISGFYDAQWDGIVGQAVLVTAGVFASMLLLYATGIIKVTNKFIAVILFAMIGIFAMYLAGAVASLFGADIAFWNQPTGLGIAVSVGIAIIAALNLAIDFEFIRRGVEAGFPKSMEWYAAFSLMVSLVWLYLEVLRLLALLRER